MLEIVTSCRVCQCHQAGKASLSPAEQGQQPESQHQSARERVLLDTIASTAHIVLHHAPQCHAVYPLGLSAPSMMTTEKLSLLPVGVGSSPFPQKAADYHRWTAGLSQYVTSHVNLKNIKMITSSQVTFLFIYRISQLCMTNFAQSHYLEQFV